MSEILVSRVHGMTLKKAKQAAEHIAAELAEEFQIEYAWEGNTLEFRRAGVNGTIAVDKKEVEIRARLGLMLSLLHSKIESEIHRFCDENFGPES
jgi:putative polyhydroxyalkanoate system protein